MAVRRDNLARKKVGYALRIFRNDQWEQVGFVESHRDAVLAYKEANYPNIKKFTITGVRLDLRPVMDEKPRQESRS